MVRLTFWASGGHSYNGAGIMILGSFSSSIPICRQRVVSLHRQEADAKSRSSENCVPSVVPIWSPSFLPLTLLSGGPKRVATRNSGI